MFCLVKQWEYDYQHSLKVCGNFCWKKFTDTNTRPKPPEMGLANDKAHLTLFSHTHTPTNLALLLWRVQLGDPAMHSGSWVRSEDSVRSSLNIESYSCFTSQTSHSATPTKFSVGSWEWLHICWVEQQLQYDLVVTRSTHDAFWKPAGLVWISLPTSGLPNMCYSE